MTSPMNLATSREQIYTAFFALLQSLPGFVSVTRKLEHWADVPAESQPAIAMSHSGETRTQTRGLPQVFILELNLWIYVATQGDEAVGPKLSPLLDALDVALLPVNGGDHVLTLNGLTHQVWIEGQTQIFEGNLGNEAVAIVPVKIKVT